MLYTNLNRQTYFKCKLSSQALFTQGLMIQLAKLSSYIILNPAKIKVDAFSTNNSLKVFSNYLPANEYVTLNSLTEMNVDDRWQGSSD